MLLTFYAIVFVQYVIHTYGQRVIDADSRIIDEIQNNPAIGYLVKFYAPWCGHCRHFEPVYEDIAREVNELSTTMDEFKNIRIVRIDATVHTDVANYYNIRGYPTIKYLRGSQMFPYESVRTKQAVLNFLKRVNGPPVRWVSSVEQFNDIRREHEVFFLFVTNADENDQFFHEFNDAVNRFLSQTYFFATNVSTIQETYFSEYQSYETSQLFAVKKEEVFLYQSDHYNGSLDEFILKEKVATFPEVVSGNMYDFVLTKKIIIIYGFSDQPKSMDTDQKRSDLRSAINDYILKHTSKLHDTFQFAWSKDLELLSNIAVWPVEGPVLFLYDSVQRKYGIYSLPTTSDQTINVNSILDSIVANYSDIIRENGNTITKQLLRPFRELSRTIMAMIVEAPLLSMLIIGLPASALSIICYCVCCLPNETFVNETEHFYRTAQNYDAEEPTEDNEEYDVQKLPKTASEEQKTMDEKKNE